jgi:DNA-binding CsgD family transcriptional regulator
MKTSLAGFARRYRAALRKYFWDDGANLDSARKLAQQALGMGLHALTVARTHRQALDHLLSSGRRAIAKSRLAKCSETFFSETISLVDESHKAALEISVQLDRLTERLNERTAELLVMAKNFRLEKKRRQAAEKLLARRRIQYERLRREFREMQVRLRELAGRILRAHQDEKKRMSGESNNGADRLLEANARFEALAKEANLNIKRLNKRLSFVTSLNVPSMKKRRVQLSSREIEVLKLIAESRANKQAAAELGISIKTVEKHRQHLMEKLNIHDISGLTRYAIAVGITEAVDSNGGEAGPGVKTP